MFKQYYFTSFLFLTLFSACDSSSVNSSSSKSKETQTPANLIKEDVDINFNDFIYKFSTDSTFQLSRTKFPLKTKWYDSDNGRDTIIYKEKSSFEMMDFRRKKSKGEYDQWEQKIVVDKNNTSAKIEIRGIENGIMVDYLFEKTEGKWMLIAIVDSST